MFSSFHRTEFEMSSDLCILRTRKIEEGLYQIATIIEDFYYEQKSRNQFDLYSRLEKIMKPIRRTNEIGQITDRQRLL